MHMSLVQWLLAIVSPALQIVLLVTLVKRGLRSRFPFFFNYVAFTCVAVVFVLIAGPRLNPAQYFVAYWVISAIGMLVAFAVLFEVFISMLKPFSALIDLGRMLFAWAAAFLLLASALTAVATNGHSWDKICGAIQLFERSVQLMQCGLLLLFVLFQNKLGLSWRSRGMCVALGLGIFAAVDLMSEVVRNKYPGLSGSIEIANTSFYLLNWGFWAMAFLMPEPEVSNAQDSPKRLILQRWNEALVSYGYGESGSTSTVESFLPGIERTVDRVMARKAVS
jgi:hypothetical protein